MSGSASVATPPDRAAIAYTIHGEGPTSDEAATALVAKRRAIDGGLARYAGRAEARAAQVAISEVRGRDCNRYGGPRLSTGECAITGYTADLQMEVVTPQVTEAGTIVGLIGRLGGSNPRIERFFLADDAPARTRALAAALVKARATAEAMAKGAGVALGPLLSAGDGSFQQPVADIVVSAQRVAAPPPPPPPPPPIAIDLVPRPIETQARVTASYAIAR